MKVLLDTHVLLWAVAEPAKLGTHARTLLLNESNVKWVSMASIWELAIKASLGKVVFAQRSFEELIAKGLEDTMATLLSIELPHVTRLITLPQHHRDPFDRLLVAQALTEGLPLLSADAALDAYGIQRVW